jgi:hypothetical protein
MEQGPLFCWSVFKPGLSGVEAGSAAAQISLTWLVSEGIFLAEAS